MKIYLQDVPISFTQFAEKFPEESKILSQFEHPDVALLVDENGVLSVKYKTFNPVSIDIPKALQKHKVKFHKSSPYKELMARALGLKRENAKSLKILDASGGMLGDSLLIWSLGINHLTVLERHPLIGVLIKNALQRESIPIRFIFGSACAEDFDVVFFDPMYQQKNEKSAAKKEMVFMRDVVGPDQDAKDVAFRLLDQTKRLVLKRSQKAKSLLDDPHHTISGKSTCYDIYLNN